MPNLTSYFQISLAVFEIFKFINRKTNSNPGSHVFGWIKNILTTLVESHLRTIYTKLFQNHGQKFLTGKVTVL